MSEVKEAICVDDVVDIIGPLSGETLVRFARVTFVGVDQWGPVAWLKCIGEKEVVITRQSDLRPRHWLECKRCFGLGHDDGKEFPDYRRCYECGGLKGEWVL